MDTYIAPFFGFGVYAALVTRDPEKAAHWVSHLRPLNYQSKKVIGISFSWVEQREPAGFTADKVQSNLGSSAAESHCSPEVSSFLADPDNIFVGMDVGAGFHALGIARRGSATSRAVDLWEAARMCGVLRQVGRFSVGFPMYAAVAEGILKDVGPGHLVRLGALRQPWAWPPRAAQVECAVQTAAVFHRIGLAAVFRNRRLFGVS